MLYEVITPPISDEPRPENQFKQNAQVKKENTKKYNPNQKSGNKAKETEPVAPVTSEPEKEITVEEKPEISASQPQEVSAAEKKLILKKSAATEKEKTKSDVNAEKSSVAADTESGSEPPATEVIKAPEQEAKPEKEIKP